MERSTYPLDLPLERHVARALSVPTLAPARKMCASKCVRVAPEMPREPKIVVVRGG